MSLGESGQSHPFSLSVGRRPESKAQNSPDALMGPVPTRSTDTLTLRLRRFAPTLRVNGGAVAILSLALLASACSTVKHSWVEPDYVENDRNQVKRIGVLVTPLPNGEQPLGALWDEIAKRYVNMHRDFIVKGTAYGPAPEGAYAPPAVCKSLGLEGVLWLRPTLRPSGSDVHGEVTGLLVRCKDEKPIWRAEAAGTWPSDDEHLRETADDYASEIGPSVKPFVGPSFHLLKAVLDTLPNPTLTDAEQEEKIDNS